MSNLHTLTLLALLVSAISPVCSQAQESEKSMLLHTHNEFDLTVHAPYEQTFPLFGAWEEKKWAEGWDPQFLYPSPARDQQGMVFTVEHKDMSAVWMNTAFDQAAGHVQYVYVVNDAMITLIDIHLAKAGATETHVSVAYERTALTPEASDHVAHFAKGDASSGAKWEEAINGYFAKVKAAPVTAK